MTDEEKLDEIWVDMKWVKESLSNHLSTHAKYTYLAFTTLIGMIVTLVLVLIKMN